MPKTIPMAPAKTTLSNSSLPLITVVVPVYNTARTIERCVLTIWEQTYSHLEIILVDDGSTDNSGDICDRLAGRDSRTRVIHQPNQGLSGARNAALAQCHGDFVTFVDADDTILPDMISQLYRLIQNESTLMAISALTEVYPNKQRVIKNPRLRSPLSTSRCLKAMLAEDGFTMSMGGKLFARQLFQAVQFPLGKLYEDVGTTYRLISQCPKISYTSRSFYQYYQNSGSIVHQSFSKSKLDLLTLTDQMATDLLVSHPQLAPDIQRRLCQSRFGILRQMVLVEPQQFSDAEFKRKIGLNKTEFRNIRQGIIAYLRQHRQDILKNPTATRRDRLAMYSLLLGLPVFTLAWRFYAWRYR